MRVLVLNAGSSSVKYALIDSGTAVCDFEGKIERVGDALSHEQAFAQVLERCGAAALEAGDPGAAAKGFIDFWMGGETWDRMPEQRKAPIAASVVDIGGWANALFREPTPLEKFAELEVPVLYMVGKGSPLSSRAVARRLIRVLQKVEVVELEGLGHMGPVTHPDCVNPLICRFFERI